MGRSSSGRPTASSGAARRGGGARAAGDLTGLVAARTGYSGTFWCGAALCALACVLLRARGRAGRNLPG
ncbi:hypothetical protein ACWD8L_35205 [Streptomyces sp. NPDC005133]|uniref:hypothetical protein n=1 Tax=unclassified Streptomyces TaxID=2593676 RepID=UPI0033B47723